MTLIFDPISSPGATRDLFVDLTGALEEEEVLAAVTINSGHPAVLSVSDVAINGQVVEFGVQQIAVGKGVHFAIATQQRSQTTVPLVVILEGSSGTKDTYEIFQPVVPRLCD